LESGAIVQLTDFDPAQGKIGSLSKNPARGDLLLPR
jgi:hypothetical protein